VGFGKVLRFPYMLANNGGAVFLIPYCFSLLTVSFPIIVLETTWGQLIKTKLHLKFAMLHPGLWGVGLAMLWLNVLFLPYYTTICHYLL